MTPVPEVIIACDYDDGKAEQLSTMVDAGIAVVIIHELQSPFDTKFPIQLRLIGKVFGEETRAEQLLTYINGLKADLANRVKNITDRPTAYIAATSYAGTRPFTFSTSKYDPFDLINVHNIITSEMTGGSEIPKDFAFEEITALQPNYVFISTAYKCKDYITSNEICFLMPTLIGTYTRCRSDQRYVLRIFWQGTTRQSLPHFGKSK